MRFEFKFVVPNRLLEALRVELQPFVVPDAFAGAREQREYTVRSIYFDTSHFDFYQARIEGLRVRKKIRIRGYNSKEEGGPVFLEIKKKIAEHCYKHRAALRFQDLGELFGTRDFKRYILPGRDAAHAHDEANRFFYHVQRQALRPVVLVTYDREAFQGKLDPALRITFDKRLRYRLRPALGDLYDERHLQFAQSQAFILEIKFKHGFSSWLQNVLKRHLLQRRSCSKYVICLEAGLAGSPLQRRQRPALLPAAPLGPFAVRKEQR
jgi:hypothetical protein